MHLRLEELTFRKSSYSGARTENCVEVAKFHKSSYSDRSNCVEVARFRKSSYSTSHGQDCVEVADCECGAAVRDTQNRHLATLSFPAPEWGALLTSVRR